MKVKWSGKEGRKWCSLHTQLDNECLKREGGEAGRECELETNIIHMDTPSYRYTERIRLYFTIHKKQKY